MTDALMVFAKAPVPGRAKTRLVPALGEEGAATLHAAFVRDVVERHQRPGRAVTVWRAGDPHDPLWGLLEGVSFAEQPGGDLGARMGRAFEVTLGQADRVVVLGTDSPTLPPRLVDDMFAALVDVDVAVGPACDGGYWGLGLRSPAPETLSGLFSGMPWGTDAVLAETLRRLEQGSASYALMPFWYDVDRPADLALLRAHLPSLVAGGDAPGHTVACLALGGVPGTRWRA